MGDSNCRDVDHQSGRSSMMQINLQLCETEGIPVTHLTDVSCTVVPYLVLRSVNRRLVV